MATKIVKVLHTTSSKVVLNTRPGAIVAIQYYNQPVTGKVVSVREDFNHRGVWLGIKIEK